MPPLTMLLTLVCLSGNACTGYKPMTYDLHAATQHQCEVFGSAQAMRLHDSFGADFGVQCRPQAPQDVPYKPKIL